MKKTLLCIGVALCLFAVLGVANASLMTIGTAEYYGATYKLIYDDDAPVGPVVWFDYTHYAADWSSQTNWAAGLDSQITSYNIALGYTVTWSGSWRLPATVDGTNSFGYEGDPDGDGIYSYTVGYNLANSETGHLFYTQLGNKGLVGTNGASQSDYGLTNTGDFENLISYRYWSGTDYGDDTSRAWNFSMSDGYQDSSYKTPGGLRGLAVRRAQVSTVPIPGAVWLLGSGLIGLMGIRRGKGKQR